MKMARLIIGASILLNVLFVFFVLSPKETASRNKNLADERTHFAYLSPRIFVSNQNDLIINFTALRSKLLKYRERVNERTGIYFEYLPTGTSIGVHEKETFVPASLLKLPLAMGVYKKIEQGKTEPGKMLTLKEKHLDGNFGELWKQGPGHRLTVGEALAIMIKQSDNTAQHILYDELDGSELDAIFDALDIPKERNDEQNAVVTPKNYSSILRCLYLSCYLSKDHSDELLNELTKTDFTDMLPAGVPGDVKVAHKIGVAGAGGPDDRKIFTDCGIVYVPHRPYILCIMTEGTRTEARTIMKAVSQMVYEYVKGANYPVTSPT